MAGKGKAWNILFIQTFLRKTGRTGFRVKFTLEKAFLTVCKHLRRSDLSLENSWRHIFYKCFNAIKQNKENA